MVDLPPLHVTYYFERLRSAGAPRPVQVRLLLIAKRTGYLLTEQAYFRDVRMRLHTAATSTGPIDAAQAALAGLVYAAGLTRLAYPGAEGAAARNRLEQLAGGNPALAGSAAAGAGPRGAPVNDDPSRWAQFSDPAGGTAGAAIEAAVWSATEAAVHAVVSSITAAVHSATGASTHSHHGSGSGSADSAPSHHHH